MTSLNRELIHRVQDSKGKKQYEMYILSLTEFPSLEEISIISFQTGFLKAEAQAWFLKVHVGSQ